MGPGMMGPGMMGPGGPSRPGAGNAPTDANLVKLQKFPFEVQFCWQPKTPSERQKAKETKETQKPVPPLQ
jgi:hypothetical protein